jgi:chemotaxis protein CheX
MEGSGMLERIAEAAVAGAGEVFETMLQLRPVPSETGDVRVSGQWISGIIGLASEDVAISIVIHFPQPLAHHVTSLLLGPQPETLPLDGDDVHDAIGEIANMVAGRIKNRICGEYSALSISLPSVVAGGQFSIFQGVRAPSFHYQLLLADKVCWIEGALVERRASARRQGVDMPAAAA